MFSKEVMKTLRCDGEHDLACGGQEINNCDTCVFYLEDRKSIFGEAIRGILWLVHAL